MNKEQIKLLALTKGFQLEEQPDGSLDLNHYVYEFAAALLEQKTQRINEQTENERIAALRRRLNPFQH